MAKGKVGGSKIMPHPGFNALMSARGGGPYTHADSRGVVPSHSGGEGVPKSAGTGAKGGNKTGKC
jgi:hypothetical protein